MPPTRGLDYTNPVHVDARDLQYSAETRRSVNLPQNTITQNNVQRYGPAQGSTASRNAPIYDPSYAQGFPAAPPPPTAFERAGDVRQGIQQLNSGYISRDELASRISHAREELQGSNLTADERATLQDMVSQGERAYTLSGDYAQSLSSQIEQAQADAQAGKAGAGDRLEGLIAEARASNNPHIQELGQQGDWQGALGQSTTGLAQSLRADQRDLSAITLQANATRQRLEAQGVDVNAALSGDVTGLNDIQRNAVSMLSQASSALAATPEDMTAQQATREMAAIEANREERRGNWSQNPAGKVANNVEDAYLSFGTETALGLITVPGMVIDGYTQLGSATGIALQSAGVPGVQTAADAYNTSVGALTGHTLDIPTDVSFGEMAQGWSEDVRQGYAAETNRIENEGSILATNLAIYAQNGAPVLNTLVGDPVGLLRDVRLGNRSIGDASGVLLTNLLDPTESLWAVPAGTAVLRGLPDAMPPASSLAGNPPALKPETDIASGGLPFEALSPDEFTDALANAPVGPENYVPAYKDAAGNVIYRPLSSRASPQVEPGGRPPEDVANRLANYTNRDFEAPIELTPAEYNAAMASRPPALEGYFPAYKDRTGNIIYRPLTNQAGTAGQSSSRVATDPSLEMAAAGAELNPNTTTAPNVDAPVHLTPEAELQYLVDKWRDVEGVRMNYDMERDLHIMRLMDKLYTDNPGATPAQMFEPHDLSHALPVPQNPINAAGKLRATVFHQTFLQLERDGNLPTLENIKQSIADDIEYTREYYSEDVPMPSDATIRQWMDEAAEQVPTWDTDKPYYVAHGNQPLTVDDIIDQNDGIAGDNSSGLRGTQSPENTPTIDAASASIPDTVTPSGLTRNDLNRRALFAGSAPQSMTTLDLLTDAQRVYPEIVVNDALPSSDITYDIADFAPDLQIEEVYGSSLGDMGLQENTDIFVIAPDVRFIADLPDQLSQTLGEGSRAIISTELPVPALVEKLENKGLIVTDILYGREGTRPLNAGPAIQSDYFTNFVRPVTLIVENPATSPIFRDGLAGDNVGVALAPSNIDTIPRTEVSPRLRRTDTGDLYLDTANLSEDAFLYSKQTTSGSNIAVVELNQWEDANYLAEGLKEPFNSSTEKMLAVVDQETGLVHGRITLREKSGRHVIGFDEDGNLLKEYRTFYTTGYTQSLSKDGNVSVAKIRSDLIDHLNSQNGFSHIDAALNEGNQFQLAQYYSRFGYIPEFFFTHPRGVVLPDEMTKITNGGMSASGGIPMVKLYDDDIKPPTTREWKEFKETGKIPERFRAEGFSTTAELNPLVLEDPKTLTRYGTENRDIVIGDNRYVSERRVVGFRKYYDLYDGDTKVATISRRPFENLDKPDIVIYEPDHAALSSDLKQIYAKPRITEDYSLQASSTTPQTFDALPVETREKIAKDYNDLAYAFGISGQFPTDFPTSPAEFYQSSYYTP
jgi:hypothetical protein